MNCPEIRSQLGPFFDQELPDSEAEHLRRHLDRCDACRREFERLSALAEDIAAAPTPAAPAALWSRIDGRLEAERTSRIHQRWRGLLSPGRIAAAVLFAVALGSAALFWPHLGEQRAEASNVQFRVLLDNISSNPDQALRKFLVMYQGAEIRPADAKRLAPALSFEVPDALPGGFRLGAVYSLKFGASPGILARYERGDELLVAIFHPPVHDEDFGTHRDYPCIIGKHRGHQVAVGDWRLVHVTDETTCHCVLSRMDEATELPPVLRAVAPATSSTVKEKRRHKH